MAKNLRGHITTGGIEHLMGEVEQAKYVNTGMATLEVTDTAVWLSYARGSLSQFEKIGNTTPRGFFAANKLLRKHGLYLAYAHDTTDRTRPSSLINWTLTGEIYTRKE